jgi:diguanylate cyclase (GGDEF)-like protein
MMRGAAFRIDHRERERRMLRGPVTVLLVGLDDADVAALAREDGFDVRGAHTIEGRSGVDAIVLALDGSAPLEMVRRVRELEPDAAVVVVTDAVRVADGAVAMHAGVEDHLARDELFGSLLPSAIRYAVAIRRMRRELATTDEATALPTIRGFAPIAEHHLRMADRAGEPVIFVFVRIEEHDAHRAALGSEAADELARDTAEVVLNSVRDSDVPGRIAPDTFCILLTGEAEGAETTILSRLVEAMAVHDARRDPPRALKLSVGTARYEPGSGLHLAELLETAIRRLDRSGA